MAISKNENRTSVCCFCGKGFSNEQILSAHMCVRKKRFADKDMPSSRLGFRVYQRFYEMTTKSKKPKTLDEFIKSPYYIAFVKFGRYLIEKDPVCSNEFIEHVIRNGVKLAKWTDEYIYEEYLKALLKKEPPERALERSILTMNDWCTEHNEPLVNFFANVSVFEGIDMIKNARISPWVLYLSDSANGLLSRLSPPQVNMIEGIIEPVTWQKKISKRSDDLEFVVSVLESAGL